MRGTWSCPARPARQGPARATRRTDRASASLGRLGEAAEVVHDQSPLLGRKLLQLLPGRDPKAIVLPGELFAQGRRQMNAVVGGGHALPLFLRILLAALQRATGVEHPAEESLLALDDLAVDRAGFQLLRQILGLVGHLARAGHVTTALEALELFGQPLL